MIWIQSSSSLNMGWSTLFVFLSAIWLQSSAAYEYLQYVARINALPGDRPVIGGFLRRQCVGYPRGMNWRYHWIYPDGSRRNGAYLTVDNLTKSQLGNYKCEASNGFTRLVSFTTPAEEISNGGNRRVAPVTAAPTAQINVNSLGGESLKVGGYIRRVCAVSEPGWEIYWTKPSGQRVNSPYLIVDNIKSSDAGQYTCHARNPATGATRSKWFSFNLQTVIPIRPVRIGIKNLDGDRIQIGGTIRRECLANKEGLEIYWKLPNGTRINSRYLIVNDLKTSDAGRYTCIAKQSSTGATTRSWFEFQMSTVEHNSIDIRKLAGERLTIGGQLRRECTVPGTGWNVYWNYPDGSRINSRYLVVENLSMRHIGRYTCHASNPSTGASVTSWFEVTSIARQQRSNAAISMDTMQNQNLRIGGTLSQRCVVNESGWTIEWHYPDGRVIHQDVLQVFNLSRSKFGKYWCIAKKPSTGERLLMYYELGEN